MHADISRHFIAVFVMVSLVTSAACHNSRTENAEEARPLSERIVGEWTSDPFRSQVGMTTEQFCFGADGKLFSRTEINGIPGFSTNTGTYRLVGDQVTMSWPSTDSSADLEVTFSTDRLVLTSHPGGPRSFRRTSDGC